MRALPTPGGSCGWIARGARSPAGAIPNEAPAIPAPRYECGQRLCGMRARASTSSVSLGSLGLRRESRIGIRRPRGCSLRPACAATMRRASIATLSRRGAPARKRVTEARMLGRFSTRIVALSLAGCTCFNPTLAFAADTTVTPELLARASGSVSIHREGDENPVKEIAKSIYWGALGGFVLGGAITLADSNHNAEPMRWGIVIGAFAGLGAGIYFVASRPIPASMLELRDGHLVPNAAALAALEPVPGGARLNVVGIHF